MTEIVEQKIVSGCKNPFRTFYIAVMHYGVWLSYFCERPANKSQVEISDFREAKNAIQNQAAEHLKIKTAASQMV